MWKYLSWTGRSPCGFAYIFKVGNSIFITKQIFYFEYKNLSCKLQRVKLSQSWGKTLQKIIDSELQSSLPGEKNEDLGMSGYEICQRRGGRGGNGGSHTLL